MLRSIPCLAALFQIQGRRAGPTPAWVLYLLVVVRTRRFRHRPEVFRLRLFTPIRALTACAFSRFRRSGLHVRIRLRFAGPEQCDHGDVIGKSPGQSVMDPYLLLKSLHVLGVVIFLGNIIVTAVWKALADRTGSPAIVAYAQRLVNITYFAFTALGAALIAVTGPMMAQRFGGVGAT